MKTSVIRHIFIGIIAVFSQVLIFQYLSIFGTYADPVLIFLLWMGFYYPRTRLLLFAGAFGLFQDALFDIWGINMFAKVFTIFLMSRFIKSNSEANITLLQVFGFLVAASLFHNVVIIILSTIVEAYATGYSSIIFLIGGSLYTSTVGLVLYILKGKG